MAAENKNYGFQTTLSPKDYFKNIENDFEIEGIHFSIKEGVFTVGYDDKTKEERAKELAESVIKEWEFRNDKKIDYDLDGHKWEHKDGNVLVHAVTLKVKASVSDRVRVTNTKKSLGMTYTIMSDSHDFDMDGNKTTVIANNESLKKILNIYEDEVLSPDSQKKAYYGIYKILEELKHNAGGLDELFRITGISKTKLEDIKQSAQPQRHARTPAQEIISVQESKRIIRELINKYISHLQQI